VTEHDQVPVADTDPLTVQVNVALPDQLTEIEAPLVKPSPETVALLPTSPLVGEIETLGWTVKVVLALFEEASVAVTVWAP
jgi:hypothetical protein